MLDNNTGHLAGRQQKMKQIKQFYKKEIDQFSQQCKLLEQQLQQKRKTMPATSQQKWNDPKPEPIDDLQEQLMYNEYDIDNQLIREKNEDIQKMDHNAQMLLKLVGELAYETDKADQVLDLVETNQKTTTTNLVKVKVELVDAQNSQNQGNKKWIMIAILIAILVGVLIMILVLKWK